MIDDDKRIRKRLRDDLQHYAAKCLRIRTKAGSIEPLSLNRVQRHLHERLERQHKRTGKIRAIVLKVASRAAPPTSRPACIKRSPTASAQGPTSLPTSTFLDDPVLPRQ